MTSTDPMSSDSRANLVSSSPELLTRPASKPDDRPVSSTGELCTSVATALPSPGGEGQGEGVLPQPLFTPDFPTRNEFLKLNLAAIFSLQPLALSLSPHSRSACSAYPYKKIRSRVAVRKDSAFRSKPLVVRFSEIPLRFAETSQQTLRHFSFVPTTYINLAEKNAPKSNLLRHLRHTTIVDSDTGTVLAAAAQQLQCRMENVYCSLLNKRLPSDPFCSPPAHSPISLPNPLADNSFHNIADKPVKQKTAFPTSDLEWRHNKHASFSNGFSVVWSAPTFLNGCPALFRLFNTVI